MELQMNTVLWIFVCLFTGWLTCRVLRDRGLGVRFGSWLGIAGAVLAGLIAAYLLRIGKATNGINLTSILVAFIGAISTVFAIRIFFPRIRWVNKAIPWG
jgi:uncharacterized membrane protein YeaQ/YmgE (transglycosylase-associated protein family)